MRALILGVLGLLAIEASAASHLAEDPPFEGEEAPKAAVGTVSEARATQDKAIEEIKKRWKYLEIWAHLENHRSEFRDPNYRREFQVQRGELMVQFAHSMALVLSPQYLGNLSYEMLPSDKGAQEKILRVYYGNPAERLGDFYIDFEKKEIKGPSISTKRLSEMAQLQADAEKRYTTKKDWTRGEISYLANRIKRTNPSGYLTLEAEGQIEYLAKELFDARDKSAAVMSYFQRAPRQNAIFIRFDIKGTRESLGTVGFFFDAAGNVLKVTSIRAAEGDYRKLLQPAATDSFPKNGVR